MRLKILAPIAAAVIGTGAVAVLVMAQPAQAVWATCSTSTVDDNTRVKGDCYVYEGQVRVWGDCDWSLFQIKSDWTEGPGYHYPKTGGTCWYGVQRHGFDGKG